jgi:hypothetical protein
MCPICITTTALVAAGSTSGVGVLGFLAGKVRALGRRRRELNGSGGEPVSMDGKEGVTARLPIYPIPSAAPDIHQL